MRWGVTVACFLTANLATADGVMIGSFSSGPSSAKIALVAAGEDLLAYVCSADHSFNETYGRWYRGDVADNGDFTLENSGFILSGKIAGDRVTGELGGKHAKSQAFAAALVAPDGAAGLFRVQELESDGKYTAGWIVCEDGET
ncbi:MAG TPA: hypothetical protein VNC50_14670, partial [Planctomycetia bacterium]|nr:hypothetical protein [Planctomycetia bacterium]